MPPKVTAWRTSTYTKTSNCVEVGRFAGGVAVRDTKDRAAGYFTATGPQWTAFVDAIKRGE
ncbi:DUF397 domain-containing protein [Saccharopolyspora sp. CA-218241]|uniref:DUF397 domain-containing protein n=1 Tax=Saccharopolyspora sp. CA-218241 TaxID=3240027 RepID=UPI003D96D661